MKGKDNTGMDPSGSIRVAVFGTSRSGKDHSIGGAIRIMGEKGVPFRHESYIRMVQEGLGGLSMRELTGTELESLVSITRKRLGRIAENANLLVDEHHSFPVTHGGRVPHNGYSDEKLPHRIVHSDRHGRDYEVVTTPEVVSTYDLVFYLDISSEIIVERFRGSEGCKNNTDITVEDVRCWKEFEMTDLERMCLDMGTPFIVLRDPETTSAEIAEGILERMS